MAWKKRKKPVKVDDKGEEIKTEEAPTEKPKAKVEVEDRYEVREYATETRRVFFDKANNEEFDDAKALLKILNDIQEIKDFLEG